MFFCTTGKDDENDDEEDVEEDAVTGSRQISSKTKVSITVTFSE